MFYTPRPVVSYIVRKRHELLQKEFALEDGLADVTTWGEMEKRMSGLKRLSAVPPSSPFVTILDPATGTATFLVEAIEVVERTMKTKWARELRLSKPEACETWTQPEILRQWNEYVPKHLLPRLFGYELMMAPYAIAHMRIGLKLRETGFTAWAKLTDKDRVHVYLTNSLEEPSSLAEQSAASMFEALGHEAQAVNDIKRKKHFTVMIGNPPYSGNSFNRGEWIERLIDDYRKVDGNPLGEVKVWLKDDYVKFIRFSEYHLNLSSGYPWIHHQQ